LAFHIEGETYVGNALGQDAEKDISA